MRNWKVEIEKSAANFYDPIRWWWRIKAGNGQKLAHSEDYTSRQACFKTARKVAKKLKAKLEQSE